MLQNRDCLKKVLYSWFKIELKSPDLFQVDDFYENEIYVVSDCKFCSSKIKTINVV